MFERPVSKSISANTRAVLSALSIRSPFTQELTVTTGTHDAGGAASNTPNTCASAVSVPARMSSGAVASQMASTRITVTGPVARMRSGLPPNPANAPSGARRHDVHLSRCLAGEAPKRAAAVAALCIHEAIPSLPHAHGQQHPALPNDDPAPQQVRIQSVMKCYRTVRNTRLHSSANNLRLELGVCRRRRFLEHRHSLPGVRVSARVNNGHDPRSIRYAASDWVSQGLTSVSTAMPTYLPQQCMKNDAITTQKKAILASQIFTSREVSI